MPPTGKSFSANVVAAAVFFFVGVALATIVITVVGDFTPGRTKVFAEQVRVLRNHLKPQPRLVLHLSRETPAGIEPVAEFEFK